jgi:uncharacterized membrane protein
MELWIPITIAAAFLQNIRSTVQRQLKGRLGIAGATIVRFLYGIPLATAIVCALHFGFGIVLPELNARFALWVVIGGFAQVAAQVCLIIAFGYRNFTVATAYSRAHSCRSDRVFAPKRATVAA